MVMNIFFSTDLNSRCIKRILFNFIIIKIIIIITILIYIYIYIFTDENFTTLKELANAKLTSECD